jgi:hypothetical protein
MMDRDYPSSPRQTRLTLTVLLVGGVVGILLFGGAIPGLHPDYSSSPITTFDGNSYYWTAFDIPYPLPFTERSADVTFAFHKVTFWAWITNWSALGGEYFHGNATEPNGTVYGFSMGGFPAQTNWTDQYVSPGRAVVVNWNGGLVSYILVLV